MIDWTMKKFIDDTMKRRLTYKGQKVYIKHLTSKYALVSHSNTGGKKFKVDTKDLADIE